MQAVILCYLFGIGWADFRRKQLPFWALYPVLAAAILYRCIFLGNIFWQGFCGLLPGVVLYAGSVLSREKIGRGDAIVFGILGVLSGPWNTLLVLMVSLVFSAVYSVFLLVKKKVKKGDEIAFIPFVFLSEVFLSIFCGLGV